jgi:hypothetical protein
MWRCNCLHPAQIGIGGVLFILNTVRTCRFNIRLGISLSGERLLASRDWLCPMELVPHYIFLRVRFLTLCSCQSFWVARWFWWVDRGSACLQSLAFIIGLPVFHLICAFRLTEYDSELGYISLCSTNEMQPEISIISGGERGARCRGLACLTPVWELPSLILVP